MNWHVVLKISFLFDLNCKNLKHLTHSAPGTYYYGQWCQSYSSELNENRKKIQNIYKLKKLKFNCNKSLKNKALEF